MDKNVLIVEKKEYVLIKRAINFSSYIQDIVLQGILKRFSGALETAHICSEGEIPKNIVRINSKVTIEYPDGKLETFQLVLQGVKDPLENKVSLFNEKGASVFGKKEGDSIRLGSSKFKEAYRIISVKQRNKNISLDMVL